MLTDAEREIVAHMTAEASLCPRRQSHRLKYVDWLLGLVGELEQRHAEAVQAEREACAVDAENNRLGWHTEMDGFAKMKGDAIAVAIRARGAASLGGTQ